LHTPAASNLTKNLKLASIWLKQNPSKRTDKGVDPEGLGKKKLQNLDSMNDFLNIK
jgi:hypothetical protein